jgi:hypothetical protein
MRFVIYNQEVMPTTGGGSWTSKADTSDFSYTFYKTFTVALNMVNQLFDIHNKFYTLAFTKQVVQLFIKT